MADSEAAPLLPQAPDPAAPTFVLVGGEAYELQGVPHEEREFMHSSVPFVGTAYESLRAAGIPRSNIITIVQLRDYLTTLTLGEGDRLGLADIPTVYYREHRSRTEAKCRRLLAEGGASYDETAVNPATVWSVLLGDAAGGGPAVPRDGCGAIVLAIYSHGDCHPAGGECSQCAEWFAHFPYPSPQLGMYDFVATEGAKAAGPGKNRPQNYLYATQLRLIFQQIFQRSPSRPIVGLLNYCLSGGNLEFMKRESVRKHLHVDQWPLFLMSSSQAGRESMVAGLWDAWFGQLQSALLSGQGGSLTVMDLFLRAESAYYQENLYELSNAVKSRIYVPAISQCRFRFPGKKEDACDPWHVDLTQALRKATPKPGGEFSFEAATELERSYEAGQRFMLVRNATPEQQTLLLEHGGAALDEDTNQIVLWMEAEHHGWSSIEVSRLSGMDAQPFPVQLVRFSGKQELGPCDDLAEVVRQSLLHIAQPEEVHGTESGVAEQTLAGLFLLG